jgi:hypothetical protein
MNMRSTLWIHNPRCCTSEFRIYVLWNLSTVYVLNIPARSRLVILSTDIDATEARCVRQWVASRSPCGTNMVYASEPTIRCHVITIVVVV